MSGKTIPLIEDNPSDVGLTQRALRKVHILNELVVASDGQEALDYLYGTGVYGDRDVSYVPILTLLHLKLPRVSGLEVLRRIRAEACTHRMPVIILTSSKEEPDIAVADHLAANSYILKPVDFKQFAESVQQLGLSWLVLNEPPPKAC
jgi:CheY-like chemotaxis protein